jgi:hypothetical protein
VYSPAISSFAGFSGPIIAMSSQALAIRGSSLIRMRGLILALLFLGVLACAGRVPLPRTDDLDEPVAILPVIPSKVVLHYQVFKLIHLNRVNWAKKTNKILNTLSSGKKSRLMGPKEVYKLLETSDIEYLNSILDESENEAEFWESNLFEDINKKLGVTKIIRVNLEIWDYEPITHEAFGGFGGIREDYGSIHVDTELINLSPPSLVTTSFGDVQYGYKLRVIGAQCCIIPINFSFKSEAQAADEALRQALSELLAISDREPTVQ